jgi:tRNA(fMet)-specific endonuclease VapC
MTGAYMLDTNAVSVFMRGHNPRLDARIAAAGPENIVISAISFGETLYGLAHNPAARRLHDAAEHLLSIVRILDWTVHTGQRYGTLRAEMRRTGKSLQPLDMLIAAHALDVGAALVTSDRAFRHVPGLTVEDWTEEA